MSAVTGFTHVSYLCVGAKAGCGVTHRTVRAAIRCCRRHNKADPRNRRRIICLDEPMRDYVIKEIVDALGPDAVAASVVP